MSIEDLLNGFSSLISDAINGMVSMILDFVIHIVQLILLPFDLLITTYFPDLTNVISTINQALSTALSYIGWVIDSVGLESFTILFLVNYLIFKLTLPLQVWVVKTAIAWYNNLKT